MKLSKTIAQISKRIKSAIRFREKNSILESKSVLKKYNISFDIEKSDSSQLDSIKKVIINNPWVSPERLLINWIKPNILEITFYSMNDNASFQVKGIIAGLIKKA